MKENKIFGGFSMGLKNLFKKKEDNAENDINVAEESLNEKEEKTEEQEIKEVETPKQEESPKVLEKKNEEVPEKGAVIKEISNERRAEIGPIIFKTEIEESDLEPLSIQETIFLLCSVDHFNEESKIENYEQKCEMIDKAIAHKLATADEFYMTFDRTTRFPFITQGCVEIYSEPEFAQEAMKHYGSQYRVLEVRSIKKGESKFPNDMNVFEYLSYLGMDHILVDNGKFKTVVNCQDIVPIKAQNPGNDLDKPIVNPKLRFAIIDFFEEARWPVSYEKRDEVMKTKEDKMLEELKNARLLVPMNFEGEVTDKVQNQVTIQKGKNMVIPKIETKEHVSFTPVFTDWTEFEKIYPKDKWNGLVLSFDEAISLNKEIGIVVNPLGENLIMNQQSFDALKAREDAGKNETAEDETGKEE